MDPKGLAYLAAGIGAGLTIMGGAAGIGRLAASAMEGIARQPEAAGRIQMVMIIALALVESLAIYGLLISLIILFMFGLPKGPEILELIKSGQLKG